MSVKCIPEPLAALLLIAKQSAARAEVVGSGMGLDKSRCQTREKVVMTPINLWLP